MKFSRYREKGTGARFGAAAFTLTELLVALAIVAMLALLATQVLGRVRISALATRNSNNHREIATALLAYAAEHQGSLPYGYDSGENSPAGEANPKITYPRTLCVLGYVANPAIFFSPLLNDKWYLNTTAFYKPRSASVIPWFYTHYGINRYGAMPYHQKGYAPANLPRVGGDGNSAKLMLTRDTYDADYDRPGQAYGGGVLWFSGGDFLPEGAKTYNGIVYASFCDGHVEAFRREALVKIFDSMPSGGAPVFSKRYTTTQ